MKKTLVCWGFLALAGLIAVNLGVADVFADEGTATWDTIWNFIFTWLKRIGAGVAVIGAVQIAIAFKSEDPDGKVRGLMTLGAGGMVVGVGFAGPALMGL